MDNNLQTEMTHSGLKNITFHVQGQPDCQGYLAKSPNKSIKGLVLIQEWWGLNQSICITADKFAKKGFTVLTPDLYRGKCAKNREQAGHYFKDLDWPKAIADIEAAGIYLKNQLGCFKVGIIGFCLGGALTFAALSTTQGVFDAGAPFYGVCDLVKFPLKNITVPVQAHFGDKDTSKGFSDPDTARVVENEAKSFNLDFQLIFWEGGEHAFMNQNSVNYKEDIAKKALEEVSTFFLQKLN